MSTLIKEAATATRTGPGRVLLTLITPGVGSSGTYSAEVLTEAASSKAFPRGTQIHINHDTTIERMERPEGDLRNLVGVLTEDAYVGDGGALIGEARIGSAWRTFVDEFHDFIGASIVASADISESTRTVEKIHPSPFNRCDLVTVGGRGGEITEVLEAAMVIESRSMISETVANDIRQWLQKAVRATHATGDDWAYLEDHSDEFVFYTDGHTTYRQNYSLDGVNVTLTGEPVEVRRRVEYDPVKTSAITESKNSPPVPAGSTPNQEEANMATIDDKELADLRESASRATTAATELAEATKRAEAAEAKVAESEAKATKATAAAIVAEAFGDTEAKVTRNALITAALAAEAFDADKLRADATEAAAEIAVTHGAGTPRGLGETITESGAAEPSNADILAALKGAK